MSLVETIDAKPFFGLPIRGQLMGLHFFLGKESQDSYNVHAQWPDFDFFWDVRVGLVMLGNISFQMKLVLVQINALNMDWILQLSKQLGPNHYQNPSV